ncbi:GFA family protein [Granulosicoccus antarcticus]|uniref:CENP-V/GFA domain-containing protein n=1 Tax=Granulosicoccus antarcticus IMCC3135 TaxID=1192854 RepID=A0A2Z2NXN4_9GAMM|nr:GFA family protein [Granulosicoccus antarcticus]ASJ76216.1 hypothetical protein IMCC3135_30835 [Granulosicoccus antarcticus IMCC3135]
MITGGCLCGKVRYEYEGDITEIALCHCSQCRQAQGSAFATNSPVDARKMRFSGQEYLTEFECNQNKVRAFCQCCGSPLYSLRKDIPNIMRLRLGTVESSLSCENRYHIFTASKAAWEVITDDYPQYETRKDA